MCLLYIYIYILLLYIYATHPSLWLILNYSPQIKKKKAKISSQYIHIYIINLCIYIYIYIVASSNLHCHYAIAAANNNAPVVFFFFSLFFLVSLLHLSFCVAGYDRAYPIVYILLLPVLQFVLCVSVKREPLNIMGRMFGKYYTLPFTRDNETTNQPPHTRCGLDHTLSLLSQPARDIWL